MLGYVDQLSALGEPQMCQWLSNAASGLFAAAEKAWSAMANAWRTLMAAPAYQPELHYMRGPGPKWRQRHWHDSAAR
jgi:hypothetical protein